MLEVWRLQRDNTRLSSSAPHSAQLLLNTSIKFYNGPICGYHWTRTSRTAQPRPSTENGNYGNLIMENGKRKLTHLYVRAASAECGRVLHDRNVKTFSVIYFLTRCSEKSSWGTPSRTISHVFIIVTYRYRVDGYNTKVASS